MRKNKTGLPDGCCWTRDRHAKRRLRYFGRGFSLYFRAPFGSPEFAAEYAAAIERNQAQPVRQPIGAACTIPGSINALIISYFELLLPLKGESTQAARHLGEVSLRTWPSQRHWCHGAIAGNHHPAKGEKDTARCQPFAQSAAR